MSIKEILKTLKELCIDFFTADSFDPKEFDESAVINCGLTKKDAELLLKKNSYIEELKKGLEPNKLPAKKEKHNEKAKSDNQSKNPEKNEIENPDNSDKLSKEVKSNEKEKQKQVKQNNEKTDKEKE